MFYNLDTEMDKVRMKRYELAEILGVTPTTMSLKLNGKSDISLKECIDIKKAIHSEQPIEWLFASEQQPESIERNSG